MHGKIVLTCFGYKGILVFKDISRILVYLGYLGYLGMFKVHGIF